MHPLTIKTFTFNPFGTNTYVVSDGAEAMIIDASADSAPAQEVVATYVQEQRLQVTHLVLTHAHIDHVFGMTAWATTFSLPWHAHPDSLRMLEMIPMQSSM
ncbi:MAG: MBL fold metallo-hydrolase, partial [Bacteroidetes bacterium]|nr:MBL fold metallo-hydrolase [Bacteroidota bacterium]